MFRLLGGFAGFGILLLGILLVVCVLILLSFYVCWVGCVGIWVGLLVCLFWLYCCFEFCCWFWLGLGLCLFAMGLRWWLLFVCLVLVGNRLFYLLHCWVVGI